MSSPIRPVRIESELEPREYFAERNVPFDLPIRGGWGYGIGDAVVIDVLGESEVVIRDIQRKFQDLRLEEELALLQAAGHEISAVNVEVISSGQVEVGDDQILERHAFRITLSLEESLQHSYAIDEPAGKLVAESSSVDQFGINGQREVAYTSKFWFEMPLSMR